MQGQFSEFLRALDNIIVMPEHDSEALCEKSNRPNKKLVVCEALQVISSSNLVQLFPDWQGRRPFKSLCVDLRPE